MNDLTIVRSDEDWEALYVNGALADEGHQISFNELGKHCPVASLKTYWLSDEGTALLCDEGTFYGTGWDYLDRIPAEYVVRRFVG